MGLLDRILGKSEAEPKRAAPPPASTNRSPDEQAVERYRYMLRTAPPETIEAAHAEAFARLTPEQRRLALATLAEATPPNERGMAQAVSPDDPAAMGRLATRAEMRQPGFLERSFGGGGAMGGMGFGGSLLSSLAAGFIGSMVAQSFFSSMGGAGEGFMGGHAADTNAAGDEGNDSYENDNETADTDEPDVGDADDMGGGDDFGGGDFGGGDFDV